MEKRSKFTLLSLQINVQCFLFGGDTSIKFLGFPFFFLAIFQHLNLCLQFIDCIRLRLRLRCHGIPKTLHRYEWISECKNRTLLDSSRKRTLIIGRRCWKSQILVVRDFVMRNLQSIVDRSIPEIGERESVAVAQKRRNPYGKHVQIHASSLILLPRIFEVFAVSGKRH